MFFWHEQWSPICGHWFWDNNYGATTFCQKLGYNSGVVSGKRQRGGRGKYEVDSIHIGRCHEGVPLEECHWCIGTGNECSNCAANQRVAIKIKCDELVPTADESSCKGTHLKRKSDFT